MDFIKNFNVAFIDRPYRTFVNSQNLAIDYEYFNQYRDQLVIINFSSEHWNKFADNAYRQLAETDINFLFLTYDHTRHQQCPRMFYFPYWYYYAKEFFLKHDMNVSVTDKIKTYSLGCLNGTPRPHRIANLLKLRKKPYWDKISITFFNVNSSRKATRDDDINLLSDNELNEWLAIQPSFPLRSITDRINLPQLTDSYLHLVTETTVLPGVFTTEKTWKAVAAAVPFVIFGNPGSMSFLKSQGVDIYDDVIDHKYYDNEEDVRLRLDKLHVVIDDLILQGVDKIYNQLFNRAIINRTKFFNGEFDQLYLPTITNAIKHYKQCINTPNLYTGCEIRTL